MPNPMKSTISSKELTNEQTYLSLRIISSMLRTIPVVSPTVNTQFSSLFSSFIYTLTPLIRFSTLQQRFDS